MITTENNTPGNGKHERSSHTVQMMETWIKGKIGLSVLKWVGLALIILLLALFIKNKFISHSKTTKIGFEDIGELATQAAYCTEINVTDASRELFGVQIPFTQSKYIYSYDVLVKAGYNFNDINWTVKDKTVEVTLPEVQIFDCTIDPESFEIYYEKESIFKKIDMTDNNDALKNLIDQAKADAKENGLLENARTNAETILTGFFRSVYAKDEYDIKFI